MRRPRTKTVRTIVRPCPPLPPSGPTIRPTVVHHSWATSCRSVPCFFVVHSFGKGMLEVWNGLGLFCVFDLYSNGFLTANKAYFCITYFHICYACFANGFLLVCSLSLPKGIQSTRIVPVEVQATVVHRHQLLRQSRSVIPFPPADHHSSRPPRQRPAVNSSTSSNHHRSHSYHRKR